LAYDAKNTIIFVSYQIEGTLGRRVQRGLTEATMMNNEGKLDIVKIGLQVEAIEGFSGHSDRRQLINYVTHLKPKPEQVIVCHGEKAKCLSLANFLERRCEMRAFAPTVMETFRLL
jgi:predicted metal-dependent RNase